METKKTKRLEVEDLPNKKKIIEDRDVSIPSNVINPTSEKVNPTEFYLYADLEREALKYKATSKDPENFIANLKVIDEAGARIVFVIIRMYALKTYEGKMFDLPFKAKISKEWEKQVYDLDFDLRDLPPLLQRMLFLFCNKHIAACETPI
jgi:hypothetical protein